MWVEPSRRDAVREVLAECGVQTSVHYNPIHLEPYYRTRFGFTEGSFPMAERLGSSGITLPLHPLLTDAEVHYVLEQIEKTCIS